MHAVLVNPMAVPAVLCQHPYRAANAQAVAFLNISGHHSVVTVHLARRPLGICAFRLHRPSLSHTIACSYIHPHRRLHQGQGQAREATNTMPCTPILFIHTMSSCPDARSRSQQGQGQGKGGNNNMPCTRILFTHLSPPPLMPAAAQSRARAREAKVQATHPSHFRSAKVQINCLLLL